MDLKKRDTKKGAETGCALTVVDVNGKETDIVIRLRGADSEAYREQLREIQRRTMNHLNRTRKLVRAPEEIEAESIELLVAATIGWSGIQEDGKDVPFTAANATRIYTDYPAIREQADRAVNDRANFLPSAAKA